MAALAVWNERSGYSFGIHEERSTLNLSLPLVPSAPTAIFKVISGKLPGGLRIEGTHIIGTPYEVPRDTTFEFCIRAEKDGQISDRTFFITIVGPDEPEFITLPGSLPINPNNIQYFVLDSSYVDFQIEAYDRDIAAGQRLSYFIADGDGALPPGLSLSLDGKITGLVEPALALKPEDGDGSFDTGLYDTVAYDFGSPPTNGYDSYIYDTVFFDFSIPSSRPKKLNRNYEFIISITDGDVTPSHTLVPNGIDSLGRPIYKTVYRSQRKFSIFVVGDDYFRSDNISLFDNNGLFTADATYLRAPIWLTKNNLGLYRANNYITLILDTYDTEQVIYELNEINTDISAVTLRKISSDNLYNGYTIAIKNAKSKPTVGQWLTFNNLFTITDPITGENLVPDSRKYQISYVASTTQDPNLKVNEYRLTVVQPLQLTIPNGTTFYIGNLCTVPPGLNFDPASGELYGIVPYQPAITKDYKFTVTATRFSDKGEYARNPRVFTISIIGEVDSVMGWNSPSNLGAINANFVCTLKIEATSSIPGATILYTKTSGRLPPGLNLNLDGEIIGKVNQFFNPLNNAIGLTRFFDQPPQTATKTFTSFDNNETTVDRVYTFTVQAKDQLGYSAISKTFSIKVETPNEIVYGNLRTKPFLKLDQRAMWNAFIKDSAIFTAESIYRPNDANFGVQSDLSMLVYAGIETTEAAAYVSAMGLNHKRKRFHFGNVKKATAIIPGTNTQVYEVVYIEMVDPLEPNGNKLPSKISLMPQTTSITVDLGNNIWAPGFQVNNPVTVDQQTKLDQLNQLGVGIRPDYIINDDSSGYQVSNNKPSNYYPNSISNWRERLKASFRIDQQGNRIPLNLERNYLPLWMRSIQPGTKQELDFQLAVPLCYCKVGMADDVILNIKFSGFDFKLLDFTADRYIIDLIEDELGDKYLVFKNDRITV